MKNTSKLLNLFIKAALSNLLLTTFLMAWSTNLMGQSQYSSLNPVPYISSDPKLELDLNQDGTTDLKLFTEVEYIAGQGRAITYKLETSEFLEVALTNDSASVFYRDDLIDENTIWSTNTDVPFQYVFLDWYYGNAEEKMGNWSYLPAVPEESLFYNAYLGVKLLIDNQAHYGWIRINFDIERSANVIDYAYNENPNEAFNAGKGMPTGAISISVEGYNYWDNMSTFRVNFVNEEREDIIQNYRIIIAKAEDTTCNDLEVMNSIPSTQYQYFNNSPDDNEFLREIDIFEHPLDKDGDLVERFTPYKVYILSIAASGDSLENVISSPSETFILQNYTEAVERVSARDDGNTNTSQDISVHFPNVQNKLFVSEFRVFICKIDQEFTLDEAIELDENHYSSTYSENDDLTISLLANQLDTESQEIVNDEFYKAYVLTVPDSAYSRDFKLSAPTYKFRLNNPNTYYAGSMIEDHVNSFPADSLNLENPYWHGPGGGNTSGNINIDVNNDGLDDFNFIGHFYHSYTSASNYLGINSLRNNQVLICDHPEHYNWILPLFEGNEISDEFNWSTDTAMLLDSYYSEPQYQYWVNGHYNYYMSSYYVGLRINDSEIPQYAWIKFNNKTFAEYGYQDIIIGVNELKNEMIEIYPNPAIDYTQIKLNIDNIHKYSLSICNSIGKVVYESLLDNQLNTISTNHFPKGIYLVVIKNKGELIKTQKLIIN